MSTLVERVTELLAYRSVWDAEPLAKRILREIESTHCIVDSEFISDEMLEACFSALPEHYDPPDPKRRAWHGFKAKRRYTAMVKTAPKITAGVEDI